MLGAERDGKDDLRGEVNVVFVAVAQQHAGTIIYNEKRRRFFCGALITNKVNP